MKTLPYSLNFANFCSEECLSYWRPFKVKFFAHQFRWNGTTFFFLNFISMSTVIVSHKMNFCHDYKFADTIRHRFGRRKMNVLTLVIVYVFRHLSYLYRVSCIFIQQRIIIRIISIVVSFKNKTYL